MAPITTSALTHVFGSRWKRLYGLCCGCCSQYGQKKKALELLWEDNPEEVDQLGEYERLKSELKKQKQRMKVITEQLEKQNILLHDLVKFVNPAAKNDNEDDDDDEIIYDDDIGSTSRL